MPTVIAANAYLAEMAVGLPGMVANGEPSNRISRSVETAAGLSFGQPAFRGADPMGVIAGGTQAATGTPAAGAGNTGNGTMGAVTVTPGAAQGVYTLEVVEPATNAGEFLVRNPAGAVIGSGTVGVAFSAGGLAFTLADGATDFAAGDFFNITVAFTANTDFVGIAIKDTAVPPNATTPDAYPQYYTAAILDFGVIWVTAGGTVADGQQVYWNPATQRFTATATHVLIPNAKFDSNGVDGDLVKIRIR